MRDASGRQRLGTRWVDRSMRTKGLVVIAVPIAILFIVLGSTSWFTHVDNRAQDVAGHSRQIVDAATTLENSLLSAQTGLGDYLLTGDPSFQTSYARAEKALPRPARPARGADPRLGARGQISGRAIQHDTDQLVAALARLEAAAALADALGAVRRAAAIGQGRDRQAPQRRRRAHRPRERGHRQPAVRHPHLEHLPARHRHRRRRARPGRGRHGVAAVHHGRGPATASSRAGHRGPRARRDPGARCRAGATRSGACRRDCSTPPPSCASAPRNGTGPGPSSRTSSPPAPWCRCATTSAPGASPMPAPTSTGCSGSRPSEAIAAPDSASSSAFHPDSADQLRDALVAGGRAAGERLELLLRFRRDPDSRGLARSRGRLHPGVGARRRAPGARRRISSTCPSATWPSAPPTSAGSCWSRSSTRRPTPSWCATSRDRSCWAARRWPT